MSSYFVDGSYTEHFEEAKNVSGNVFVPISPDTRVNAVRVGPVPPNNSKKSDFTSVEAKNMGPVPPNDNQGLSFNVDTPSKMSMENTINMTLKSIITTKEINQPNTRVQSLQDTYKCFSTQTLQNMESEQRRIHKRNIDLESKIQMHKDFKTGACRFMLDPELSEYRKKMNPRDVNELNMICNNPDF
jgi:hypothetical protein